MRPVFTIVPRMLPPFGFQNSLATNVQAIDGFRAPPSVDRRTTMRAVFTIVPRMLPPFGFQNSVATNVQWLEETNLLTF